MKKTMTYADGNPGPGLGQNQICGKSNVNRSIYMKIIVCLQVK